MYAKKRDLALILIWPILATVLSLALNANYFLSLLLFFAVPAAYLSYLKPKFIKKVALFSVILGVPLAIIIDHIMELTGGWFTPSSVFGVILFGNVMIEDILFAVLYLYLVAMFYEVFLEKTHKAKLLDPHLKYLFIISMLALAIFLVVYLTNPSLLAINFFYFKVGIIVGILPIILALTKFPGWLGALLQTTAYFFYLTFLFEIVALILSQWTFPAQDQFIGFVQVAGLTFPLEELFFWIILGGMAALSYYKFFDDDKH